MTKVKVAARNSTPTMAAIFLVDVVVVLLGVFRSPTRSGFNRDDDIPPLVPPSTYGDPRESVPADSGGR